MNLIKKTFKASTYSLNEGWFFLYQDKKYRAQVPGDITQDLLHNGLIEDPFFGDNYKKISWVFESEWRYCTHFTASAEDVASSTQDITFDMVDTFADVYLNGIHIGELKSMFISHRLNVKDILKEGENELEVIIHPIRQKLREIHNDRYHASFNDDRVLVRKAQCHFGWDWAPNFPGTGIAGDVRLYCGDGYRLSSVFPTTKVDGRIGFLIESEGNNRDGEWPNSHDFSIVVEMEDRPGSQEFSLRKEKKLFGQKNLLNIKVPNPRLWFPNGYGEQPLYKYRVSLVDKDKNILDSIEKRLGIRELVLNEDPIEDDRRMFRFEVNGMAIRVLGSNWVPADICTGSIPFSRYKRLLESAKEAGLNMLRVWGGGIYEKESFYDLCDELGILVYQDFMFSCQFIPDDTEEFRLVLMEEATHQIKRLRGRTCLAIWSSGNELADAFICDKEKMSKYSQKILLPGLVSCYDGTRKCIWDSPYSWTDQGNDPTSGDSHSGMIDESIEKRDIANFRSYIAEGRYMFQSEEAILGLSRLRSFRKYMPKEQMWPTNGLWEERMSTNPYSHTPSFTKRHHLIVEALFGEKDDLADFTKKSMIAQAEMLKSSLEYSRAYPNNSGFLNWMYNDIWGMGTWSIVDYYFEKKPTYYFFKRVGKRRTVFFIEKEGKAYCVVINDSPEEYRGVLRLTQETIAGAEVISEYSGPIGLAPFSSVEIPFHFDRLVKQTYLYVSFNDEDDVYFFDLWKDKKFETDLSVFVEEISDDEITLHIKANQFARTVLIDVPEDPDIVISDNYFDIPKGRSKKITIHPKKPLRREDIKVLTFADEWLN